MNYRVLTKMSIQSGKGWFELLPAAVFKMNCSYKQSIRNTSYKIMFGRESSCVNLLKLIHFDSFEEEIDSSEDEHSQNDAQDSDDFNEFDYSDFEEKRKASWNMARESIVREQTIQKRIFDAKVQHKRYN